MLRGAIRTLGLAAVAVIGAWNGGAHAQGMPSLQGFDTGTGNVVGEVARTRGVAFLLQEPGRQPAESDKPVFPGDILATGADGALGVMLADGTRVALGPMTRVVLDRVVYAPQAARGGVSLRLLQGVVVVAPGGAEMLNPGSVMIRTVALDVIARGTVGVSSDHERYFVQEIDGRTVFDPDRLPVAAAFPDREPADLVVTAAALPRSEDPGRGLVAGNVRGTLDLDAANTGVRAIAPDRMPEGPFSLSRAQIEQLFGLALLVLPDPLPAPAPPPPPPEPEPQRYILNFETGTVRLVPNSRDLLRRAMRDIGQSLPRRIVVVGHADREGASDFNRTLSRERAQTVRQYMIDQGVPARMIETAYRGEDRPLIATPDGVADVRNRRVEIELYY